MSEGEPIDSPGHARGIADRFALPVPADRVDPYGTGLINATYLVTAGDARFILQRINERVFPAPERIMANLAALAAHLAGRDHPGLRLPGLIRSRDGLPFVRAADGGVWRLMEFIAGAAGLAEVGDLDQAAEIGRILGRFHASTRDLPPDSLAVTLPGFHETPRYIDRLEQVLGTASADLGDDARRAVAFVAARGRGAGVLEAARRQGRVPSRVIHGDPKLDNILFDRESGRAVSLIDLDTVQPGLVLYDLGDCLRSCCNRRGESAPVDDGGGGPVSPLPSPRFDLDLCRAILAAYANEAGGLMAHAEIGLLFDAIRLIPFELGVRFLTDHLEGNRYFRITEPGQNLRKARVQFALVADIEDKEGAIRDILATCFATAGAG